AGFEPAASCSQSRRDNRATLHPESGCKYKTIFCLSKTILEIRNRINLILSKSYDLHPYISNFTNLNHFQ
ncbi:MAG: hypothetical protein K2X95_03380, partial [Flavobacteriaceae bacterium]|nr:hypothetical protein [Flavobacteriaceae bacterium]